MPDGDKPDEAERPGSGADRLDEQKSGIVAQEAMQASRFIVQQVAGQAHEAIVPQQQHRDAAEKRANEIEERARLEQAIDLSECEAIKRKTVQREHSEQRS